MSRQIVVDILGDASGFTRSTKEATQSAGKFKNVLTGIGQGIGQAAFGGIADLASRAGYAVVDFTKDSIRAASDLNETMSKSTVIFGDGSDAVVNWAKKASTSMGLSERAALDAASGFAGLFKTVGIGLKEATDNSQAITQLGADLASFFNTDMDQALQALKSGLSGEAEPLRKFNVFLSETAVNAKLTQMGIKRVGGQFTEAQKITARYQLIMEQTTDAQGDFIRTSDQLANSQRTLDAKIENLQGRIGQGLIPIVQDATNTLVGLLDAMDSDSPLTLADRIGNLGDAFFHLPPGIDQLTTTLGDNTQAFHDWFWGSKQSAEATEPAIISYTENIAGALGRVADKSTEVKDHVKSDNRSMVKSYADFASFMLGKYNDDYDRALSIQEARTTLSRAKHNEEGRKARAEAYADLAKQGALSKQDYDDWLGVLRRLAKDTKGQVHKSYMDAIADVQRLKNAASGRIGIQVTYDSIVSGGGKGGKASGGAASGRTLVGEQGPEVVDLPAGSFVHNNAQTRRMMGGTGSPVNIYVSTPLLSPGGAEALAAAVEPYITRRMQRQQLIGR